MKAKKFLFLLLTFLVLATNGYSQSVNKLTIPAVESGLGKDISIPIYLTNDAGIVAAQFKMHFPENSIVNTSTVSMSDRKVDHTVSVKSLGNNDYLFVIFSAKNTELRGNSGILLRVTVKVPEIWTIGSAYPFTFYQIILSTLNGTNVATASDSGSIKVVSEPRPDVTVQNIMVNQQNVSPLGKLNIGWLVNNIGDKITSGGWSEQVSIMNDNGEQVLLGTTNYDQLLDAGAIVSRQAEFSVPEYPGLDRTTKVQVKLIPNSTLGELITAQSNNVGLSDGTINIDKRLNLSLVTKSIPENNLSMLQCRLYRSGSRTMDQTFTLRTDASERLKIPESVIIKAGQSGAVFYVNSIDNKLLNLDSIAIIYANGISYSEVSNSLTIIDDEIPFLRITSSKNELIEGDTFTLTIEREIVTNSALKVNLSTDFSKRFGLSSEVTIPANEKSITVNATVVDDAIPALTDNPVFTASAFGYTKATCSVSLADNDVPVISLSIAPGTISESAGYQATIGLVRRQGSTDNVITIKLTDDSNTGIYYSTPMMTLKKGVSEKQFTVGVVDNALVDGNRDVNITAAVYISACGCSASGTGAGVVQSKLTVLDDDGPSLRITSSQTMLAEGKSQATLLTISRNTPTTEALTLTLSSDRDTDMTYQKTVTIPAGSTSVTIPVEVINNNTTEGDRTVTFTASATGFTKGVCWAMITDQTLADATVNILSVTPTSPLAKGILQSEVLVTNSGVALLATHTSVDIYLCNTANLSSSSTKQLLTTLYTSKGLAPQGNESLVASVTLPDLTGQYYIIAQVDAAQTLKELSYLNNVSDAQSLKLLPCYTVNITSDKNTYKPEEVIVLSGKAVAQGSSLVSGVAVDVYVINNGYRQSLKATTDITGAFQVNFSPISGQMGHFIAGACYPNEALTTEQVAFDIYGLKQTSNSNIIWDVLANEQNTGEIEISNPGTLLLTGLKTAIISNPATGVQLTFNALNDLSAGGAAKLKYTLTGSTISTSNQYDQLKFQITTNEGASLDITAYYYCRSAKATLKASVPSIQTTMAKGAIRTYQFTVTNNGKGASGKISVMIPTTSWLSLVTPAEIPSLGYGELATVVLQLSPTENMPANIPITGTIAINCENGNGIPLPYSIETVSEKTGTLKIDVCDEYTYNTEAAPHLSGALVKVKLPYTGVIVSDGVTGADGLYTLTNLPEGYYTIVVTAPKHGNYQNEIYVEPGKTTTEVVFIQFQAITYSWDVIQTTVEDKYEVSLTTKFETNVPKPVVLIDLPDKLPALSVNEEFAFIVNLTNVGLITAKNVELNFPDHPIYEFITSYKPSDIAANTTIQVFVIMHHKNVIQKSTVGTITTLNDITGVVFDAKDVFCNVYSLVADYFYLCGGYELRQAAVKAMDIDVIDFICSDFKITIPWPENPINPIPNNPIPNKPPGGNNELQGPWDNGNYNPDCLLYTLCPGLKRNPSNTKGLKKVNSSVEEQNSVCASVSLKFNQSVTLTREAFKGTLKIMNGAETADMKNIKLDLEIKDETGMIRNDLFQINTISLDQITGIEGNGIIEPMKTGSAIIQFIPEKGAAPIISKAYSFGGSFSYLDPFTGVIVTNKLLPVTLTVKPCPDLYLTYFMQRDVFGDDPLTATVEPIEPAELSLLINNKGAGDATKVVLDSEQPKIIENEKGLNIDFKMIGSSLNGAAASIGLTKVDFGSIPAGKTSFGQWWFTSSLLGHFSKYEAKLTHLTSYDNPDLSLISDVSVHELIRSLNVATSTGTALTGFLANDIPDADDAPDMLYLSDGNIDEVSAVSEAVNTKVSDINYSLTVKPSKVGWNYGITNDPGNGHMKLISVVRQKDNASISLRNFWQTDRTMRDGKDPLYENRIQFADKFTSGNETYILTFEPKPDKILEVSAITGIPEGLNKVNQATIIFNKPINPTTFTKDDIMLKCESEAVDLSNLKIIAVSASEYTLDLSTLPGANGYYLLTVQTSNITDTEGFQGENGKQVGWTQHLSGDIKLAIQIQPEASGTVNPTTGSYTYGSLTTFTANPSVGCYFKNWTLGGDVIGSTTKLNYLSTENKTIVANFEVIKCKVNIQFDAAQGAVSGGTTGIYIFGSEIIINAVPANNYNFKYWTLGGVQVSTNPTYTMTVDGDKELVANFDIKTFTVNVESNDYIQGTVSGEGTFNYNQSVSVVATSKASYKFINWTENDVEVSTNATYTFTVSVDRILVANFGSLTVNVVDPKTATVLNNCSTCDVIVASTGTLTVDATNKEVNSVTVEPGGKLILSNPITVQDLTLKADNSGSFSTTVTSGMTVNGMFRYIKTMDDQQWYFISFPCNVLLATQIKKADGTSLGEYGIDWAVFYYDGESRAINLGLSQNWKKLLGTELVAFKGYAIALRTGMGTMDVAFTLDKSIINQSESEKKVPVTAWGSIANIGSNHKGWNLVGQPYLSKFSGKDAGVNYMVFSPDGGTTYRSVPKLSGETVSPFTAYFVQADAALETSKITFDITKRMSSPASSSIVASDITDRVDLNFNTVVGTDKTGLVMDIDKNPAYIIGEDMEKWVGTGKPQVYTLLGNVKYAYNGLPMSSVADLPVGVYTPTVGPAIISADATGAPGLSQLLLTDKTTGVITDLLLTPYNYIATAGTTNTRFVLNAKRVATDSKIETEVGGPQIVISNLKLIINNLSGRNVVRIYDALGRMLVSETAYDSTFEIALKVEGVYTFQIQSGLNRWTKKVVAPYNPRKGK